MAALSLIPNYYTNMSTIKVAGLAVALKTAQNGADDILTDDEIRTVIGALDHLTIGSVARIEADYGHVTVLRTTTHFDIAGKPNLGDRRLNEKPTLPPKLLVGPTQTCADKPWLLAKSKRPKTL